MTGLIAEIILLGILGTVPVSAGEGSSANIFLRLEDALPQPNGVVLLVFFSTECFSCYVDLFETQYLVERNGWPVSVVGISSGYREDLVTFLEKYGWSRPVVWDRRKAVFRKFGVRFAPFKVILAGGETVYRDDPYRDREERLREVKKWLEDIFSPRRSP